MNRKLFNGLLAFASFTLLLIACGDSPAQPEAEQEASISEEEFTQMKRNVEYLERELESAREIQSELEEELKSLNP